MSIEAGNDGKGVVFRTKKARSKFLSPLRSVKIISPSPPKPKNNSEGNKPNRAFVRIPMNFDRRRTYRFLRKHLGSTDYRQDLKEVSSIRKIVM